MIQGDDPKGTLSVQEFAAKVKEKYPQYKDVEDQQLVDAMVKKYPQYESVVNFDEPKKKVPQGATPSESLGGESLSQRQLDAQASVAMNDFMNPVGRLVKKTPILAEVYSGVESLIGSILKAGEMAIKENVFAQATANPALGISQDIINSNAPIDSKIADTIGRFGDVYMESSRQALSKKQEDYGISIEQQGKGIVGNVIEGDIGTAAKLTASTVAHQIPQLAAMVVAGPAAGSVILGTSATGGKYAEIQDDPTLSSQEKAAYSLAIGTVEGLAEYMFKTDVSQVRRAFGKKETLDQFRKAVKKELKKESFIKSTLEEGGEELAVGVVDLLIESGLKGNFENWNYDSALELADAFLIGSVMGGGTHTVTRGVNALGSTKNERDISKAKRDIQELKKKKDGATPEEQEVIDELISEKVEELVDLNGEDANFYSKFSDEDITAVNELNKKIREASKKYNASNVDSLRDKYKAEIESLRDQKETIESKYSDETPATETTEETPETTPEVTAETEEQVETPVEEEASADIDVQEAKEIKLSDGTTVLEGSQVVSKNPATGEDIQGTIVFEGDPENPRVAVETETDIVELGTSEDIKPSDIKPFRETIQQTETLTANEDGTLTYNREDNPAIPKGTKLKVDTDKGMSAVSVFSEGKFVPLTEDADREKGLKVQMLNQDGEAVELYGQDALDATYNIMLAMNEAEQEQLNKLLDNEETIAAIEEAEESARKDTKPTEEAEGTAVEETSEEVDIILLDEQGGRKPLTGTTDSDPRNIATGKMKVSFGKDGITFTTKEDTGRMKEEGGEMFVPYSEADTMPGISKFKKGTKEYAFRVASVMGIADEYKGDPLKALNERIVKPNDIGKEGTPSAKRFTAEQGSKIAGMISNFNKTIKRLGASPVKVLLFDNTRDLDQWYVVNTGNERSNKSKGSYIPLQRTIVIDLSKADMTTLPHEMLHAYVASVRLNSKKISEFTNIIESELRKGSASDVRLANDLAAFRDAYVDKKVYGDKKKDDAIIAEEFLAQYVGVMANHSEGLPQGEQLGFAQRVRAAIIKFLAKYRIVDKSLAVKLETRQEALDFINGFVNAIQGRVDITADTEIEVEEQGEQGEVGTISIPKQQIEVIDAPKLSEDTRSFVKKFVTDIKMTALQGRKFITNMYDYTNAGVTNLGNGLSITLFGGRNYVPMMMERNGVELGEVSNLAAFNSKENAEGFINNAREGKADLFAPHSGTLTDSWQFQHHIFESLVNLVLDNKILSKSELIETFNSALKSKEAMEAFAAFNKKNKSRLKSLNSFKKDPLKLVELLDAENNYSPKLRKALNQKIASNKKFQKAIGVTNLDGFYNRISDPLNIGVSGGEIMTFVEFDPNSFKIVKTKPGDVNHHPSFGWVVMAKIKGIYHPDKYYKSYDITESYTKYNKSGTVIERKVDTTMNEFIKSNVKSSAGAAPKIAEVNVPKQQIDFAGIDMKVQELPASRSANIPTGGMAYVPVSKLYDLMDMRDGDRGGLYETARDKKRVEEIAERFKKEGYNSTDGWYQPIYVDVDAGGFGWIGEGNHRVLAAMKLGMTHLPVKVEFGAARDDRFIYHKNYSRVPTQVVTEEKIEQLKEQAGPYYHIKYASIWETNLPTNQEPKVDEARQQIDWNRSEFGREKVNNTIITRSQFLQKAVQDLLEGKITNAEYQETAKIVSQIDPIAKFFLPASNDDMQKALGKGKAKKLNVQLEDGEYVGLRLDIPAYVNNNIWVVTAHKGTGAPLTYGSVAWATDVKFGTNPKVAAFIAAGKNMDLVGRYRIDPVEVDGKTVYKFYDTKSKKYYAEKGKEVVKNDYKSADRFVADRLEKQDKSTIGKMLGKWKNFDGKTKEERDASAIKKVEEIVKIENSYPGSTRKGSPWRQIGMNPFRHSFFYDRRTGKPVVAAAEVVQIGGLVYAKDVEYASWDSDQFTVDGYKDADGQPVKFQIEGDAESKVDQEVARALEKGEIPQPLYEKTWYQKLYSALFRNEIEMGVLKLQEKKDARIAEIEYQSRLISNKIKSYAKTPEALKLASEYMTAEDKTSAVEAIKKLPKGDKLLKSLREARAFIDGLSSKLVNDPAFDSLPDELRFAVQDNITTYLRASYRFFNDKNFDIKKRRDAAVQAQFDELQAREIALMSASGMSKLDIGTYIESIREDLAAEAAQLIDSYIADLENVKYQPSIQGTGIKIPNTAFRRKKDVPEFIKKLLGEEKNPVNRFANSSKSLANIIYKTQMVNGIINLVGENSDYILDSEPGSIKAKMYTKVNDEYSPLNGKWVHNEIMDMVNQKSLYQSDKAWANAYFSILKLGRKSKVIWNATTWRKNLTGGWYFIMANGIANPGFAKDFTRRTKLMFNKKGEKFQVDDETKEFMRLLAEYGVSGKSVDANLIGLSQAAYQFSLDGDESTYASRAKMIFENISNKDKWLQEKYAAVDDYTKLIIFRSEVQSYAKKLYGKQYSELNESQKDNVHEQAAERVKQSTPTFSRLPKWYNKVAVIPIVGDFMSFRLESLRSYGMNVFNAISDIKKSQETGLNEVQKKEYLTAGLRRLAGSGAVFALKMAIVKIMGQLLLDDEDEKLEEDAKALRPEWMEGQTIIPRSIDKEGNVRAYNYSSEDPYGDVSDIFGGIDSWEAMAKDFVRPNIAASFIFNLVKGEDIYGRKIADYSDSRINNMFNMLGYTAKQIVIPPTVASSYRDAYVKSELPKKDKVVNLAAMVAERSVIRDYKYNIIQTFNQDLRKISETRKSYKDYDNPARRLKQLDEIKKKYEAIVAISLAKKNYELMDKAELYIKRKLEEEDVLYVLDGIILK